MLKRKTFISGGIDAYFRKEDSLLPRLTYRRSTRVVRRFEGTLPAQPTAHIELCGSGGPGAVRDVEYKHFGRQGGNSSFVVREGYESCGGECVSEAEMIVPLISDRALFDKYTRMAKKEADEKSVFFVGGVSRFEAPRIDATIADAMRLFERLEGRKVLEGALRGAVGGNSGRNSEKRSGNALGADAVARQMLLHAVVSLYNENISWIKVSPHDL